MEEIRGWRRLHTEKPNDSSSSVKIQGKWWVELLTLTILFFQGCTVLRCVDDVHSLHSACKRALVIYFKDSSYHTVTSQPKSSLLFYFPYKVLMFSALNCFLFPGEKFQILPHCTMCAVLTNWIHLMISMWFQHALFHDLGTYSTLRNIISKFLLHMHLSKHGQQTFSSLSYYWICKFG